MAKTFNKYANQIDPVLFEEWKALRANGIVPQNPRW